MADKTVTVEEFTSVLSEFVKFELDENKKAVHDGIKKISREAKQEVESKSRVSDRKYGKYQTNGSGLLLNDGNGNPLETRNKHYKDSWTTSVTEEKGVLTVTVHNKKWQLVHLLENGHLLKDGTGRVYGEVPAYKHVEIAEKHAEEKVDALLEGL